MSHIMSDIMHLCIDDLESVHSIVTATSATDEEIYERYKLKHYERLKQELSQSTNKVKEHKIKHTMKGIG